MQEVQKALKIKGFLMNKKVMENAIHLATQWQDVATQKLSDFENTFHVKMQKLLNNPVDKVFLIELMDQSFRSHDVSRVENQIDYLFSKYGMATFFTNSERFLVFLFRHAGTYIPQISIPMFVKNIRSDTKNVVLPAEDKLLNKHLTNRRKHDTRVNLNLIGEAVLGENESRIRIQKYKEALENPNIDYLSIKISTIYSQINSLAFEETVEALVPRLKTIYIHAKNHPYKNKKGEWEHKFVNLDMEEYRDLSITVEAFKRALDDKDLLDYKAGIVLQAYLPDSHLWQKDLTEWAKTRVSKGGSPIKVRLVKGANLEMEKTEASLRGWKLATYTDKIDTDSNYKIMAEYGLLPENVKAVHLGAASHNLFELAYAFELAKHYDVVDKFSLEMLEGMSEAARVAIASVSGQNVILYAPIAGKEQFTNAIAYLVRRLDENTSEDNFIRYSFGLTTDSPQWEMLKQKFVESFTNRQGLFVGQKRKQNRLDEHWDDYKGGTFHTYEFKNEPDTDFVLECNQQWAQGIRKKWMLNQNSQIKTIPVVVGNKDVIDDHEVVDLLDKSQIKDQVVCGRYVKANKEDLKKAVEVAKEDPDSWRKLSRHQRHELLSKVAIEVRKKRGDLIGVAAAEVGKVFTETDVEVSEAIDFLEFYSESTRYFANYKNLELSGKGVGLVTPPWNFPIAIPMGGVAASLAAGNTVILKPASDAVMCAYEMCLCFWNAGISKNTLQFVPCPGSLANEYLIKNKDIDFVILTGGESTAQKMLESRPQLFLSAETGGKDATIVTAMADREQAIKNVIHSAFSNSGQKCSATSLLILENEVYFDRHFQESLVDAAQSLKVGSVWDLDNKIGTLANKVSGALKQAIENLEDGESWVLKPEYANDNEYMLKPAIKWGVKEGSFCHMTELFGPVLSVMRADNLEHAVKIANQTGYGLTSGIESLDEREVEYWKKNIKAGNLYVNRGTTGAIVLRQPFGGIRKSAIGSGRKAGAFNYITQFVNFKETRKPHVNEAKTSKLVKLVQRFDTDSRFIDFSEDISNLQAALQSYLENYENEFLKERDFFKLRGEDNFFKYLKINKVAIRICENNSLFDSMARILAAKVCGVKIHLSLEQDMNNEISQFLFRYAFKMLKEDDVIKRETENDFVKCFKDVDRIMYSNENDISEMIFKKSAELLKFIVRSKPLMSGRIELLNFFEEQSVSHSYHRYGNLGRRSLNLD
jgi:RHH-type transcriptional regulator, proline utilization regulon repressor / proline dehydrogenase / delta 1-pyrroline-5-carboxylate dehydrogenase